MPAIFGHCWAHWRMSSSAEETASSVGETLVQRRSGHWSSIVSLRTVRAMAAMGFANQSSGLLPNRFIGSDDFLGVARELELIRDWKNAGLVLEFRG